MAAVRLGFIGYGLMGERLMRAAVAQDVGKIVVSGAWDPAASAMARLASDLPQIARHGSIDELIEASSCIYIASPPASHLAHARRAFASGRAVFCEKPLATDLADARAFAAEAAAKGVRAAVNFPFASSLAVDQLRAWTAQGATGTVRALRIEVGFAAWPRAWQREAAGWLDRRAEGGFTREVVSHFLFLARRLLGPLELRHGTVEYPNDGRSERGLEAVLTAGQVPVCLSGRVGATDADEFNAFTLEGEAGSIRLRDWAVAERLVEGAWTAAPDAVPIETIRPVVLARQLAKVAAMTRGEAHDLASLGEALAVQEVVEAVLRREA